MDNPWSDFVATPPSLASATLGDYYDPILPAPTDFYLSEQQVANVFEPPEPVSRPSHTFGNQSSAPVSFASPFASSGYAAPVPEYNEIENRTLLIMNLDPETTEEEIDAHFNPFNSIRHLDISSLSSGQVTIEYYDLRHALDIKRTKNNEIVRGAVVSVCFAPLAKIDDVKKPPNNGTIVVFHLQTGLTDDQIQMAFGQYGDVRQIRGTPMKPTQRFIEYWDVRSAERALDGLNGKYMMGSKVSIEFSLPGGFRRNVQRPDGSSGRGPS
jgi:RNA recognition motif-containing protein